MRSRPAQTLMVMLLLFAAGGCERGPETGNTRITVAQFGDFFLYAPLYVAVDAGFMASQGLDVTITSTGGDENTWAAVMSGQAQFGVADPTFTAIAGERGRPGRVVAALVNSVPFWGVSFSVAPDTTAPDSLRAVLLNRTVATFPAPSTAFALQRRLAEELGIPAKIREAAPGNLLATVQAGQADIALELEPTVSQAVAQGAHVLYSMADQYPDFVITGVTVTPQYLNQNRETVNAFVCALQHAFDFIHTQPDSAVALLGQRFPIPADVASAALHRVLSGGIVPDSATVSSLAWDNAIQLRRDSGDLSQPAPWTEYVSNDAARQAINRCR